MSTQPTHEEIQARAHQLWQAAGMPQGRDDEFWEQAEQELQDEQQEEEPDDAA